MALTTARITELPLRSAFPIVSRSRSLQHLFAFPKSSVHSLKRYISSSLRTNHTRSPNSSQRSAQPKVDSQPEEPRYVNRDKGQKALETIVLRLRNLGIGSDDEDEDGDEVGLGAEPVTEEEGLRELLQRDWLRPDSFLAVDRQGAGSDVGLPWQREEPRTVRGSDGVVRKRTAKAPTLAELTIEDEELRRLRRMGMLVRERINVPKAGLTKEVMEKIHDKWRKEELVRLRFHEYLANDMKTAHEIVERRTGGLVIWQSGSVMMVYRGTNYKGPDSRTQLDEGEGESFFVPAVSSAEKSVLRGDDISSSTSEKIGVVTKSSMQQENLSEEEVEYNNLLDGLGPRFVEWWGIGVLPVDADLLPQKIPGYKTPFRLLPTGMRSRLTNAEMTDLRKTAKSLPCHFALGRNRNHQGLATAIIKLWEKSLVAKIAVKRGIQNTNNKIMAEELKMLTGGTLLLRNKFYIVIYRGKDFVPPDVAAALSEREELTKQIQNVEEKVRIKVIEPVSSVQDGSALAGTLAEFYEAQARWGRDVTEKDREKMLEEASKSKTVRLVRRVEHKLALAQAKKHKAEKLLSKIEESVMPSGPDVDQETITEEERTMFRRVGLKMKSYMPLGIRGVFDGIIEQMHLHWKHRELVKLISKQKTLAFVEEMARLLEHESGGVLVTIERIPKGYMLLYYRGKNYKRPISMRPRNLLTKQKALKLSVAMQRHEGLSEHIAELERTIKQMNKEIGPVHESDIKSDDVWSSEENRTSHQASEFSESEDEDALAFSDDEEEGEDDEEDDTNWEEDDEESESNAS